MGPQRSVRSDKQAELLSLIRAVQRRHKLLLARISKTEELADAIACDIERLLTLVEAGTLTHAGADYTLRGRKENGQNNHQTPGAFSVELDSRADGSAVVRIDGKEFKFSPTLADLLAVLCEDTGRSADDLIGWKSINEVARLLKKKTGRRFTNHVVTQNVHRLRQVLFKAGLNPDLVQTNRRYGLRFALRRSACGGKTMTDESSSQRTARFAASADGGVQTECWRLLARKTECDHL
jgi:DNA-binding response OmpR family regulator